MEAMISHINGIVLKHRTNVVESTPDYSAAKEIAEHLEEYDKWKLENCSPHYEGKWTLYNETDIIGYFTNSELYEYWLSNVYGK